MNSVKVKTRYKILLGVISLLVAVGLTFAFLPWKTQIEKELQKALEAKGLSHVRLTLLDINLNSVTVQDVAIGDENPFILKKLTLLYSPLELLSGKLNALTISGASVDVQQTQGQWGVQGFASKKAGGPLRIPVESAQISSVPLDHLRLNDSQINIIADAWNASANVEVTWAKMPDPDISLQADNAQLGAGKITASIKKANINVKFDGEHENWQGLWDIEGIQIDAGKPMATMSSTGTVKAVSEGLLFSGQLKSKDAALQAAFKVDYSLSAPEKTVLMLTKASMPWHGGTLALENATLPLTRKSPIRLNILVDKVSVDEFMQTLTGKRVSATGVVSGVLPLTIGLDGTLSFGQVMLKADSPGTIVMPADTIPGDNEQIALTRQILKNFHYDDLSLSISSDKDNKVSILMALGGNNPDVLDGRAVKLNINLNGDILDFIQQNAMLITDPQQFLKQRRK
jgi:hypothetical protein